MGIYIYDGTRDPVSYLEHLEGLWLAYGIPRDHLLFALLDLLRGKASLWAWNDRSTWHMWDDFVRAFRRRCFPAVYTEDLVSQIVAHRQKDREPIYDYVEELQILIWRRGDHTPGMELSRQYKNLQPEYKLAYLFVMESYDLWRIFWKLVETMNLLNQRKGAFVTKGALLQQVITRELLDFSRSLLDF